jgi:SAM-dependent methyltransferase
MMVSRLIGPARACPYCGEESALKLIGRKKLLMDVLLCGKCSLIFRYPVDSAANNFDYYQDEYRVASVTELPDDESLKNAAASDGLNGEAEFESKIEALKALQSSGRVLDFGCSWGYALRHFLNQGFSAVGFEISKTRAAFGRDKLGLPIYDNIGKLSDLGEELFDAVFVNHVLEHLPAPKQTLRLLARMAARDGLLFIVGPNFTGAKARSGLFWSWIGQDHPIAPTADFLRSALNECGFSRVACGSGPFDRQLIERLRKGDFESLDRDGDELLVIARRN